MTSTRPRSSSGQRREPVALARAGSRWPVDRGPRGWPERRPARRPTRRWPTPRCAATARPPARGRWRPSRCRGPRPPPVGRARRARRWRGRRPPRSPVAGSGPDGRRAGRACGTPNDRARTAAAHRPPAAAPSGRRSDASRSVTASSRAATCSAAVRPLARSMIQRSSCDGSLDPGIGSRATASSRS